ncbi:MAG: hypothetical protein QOD09_3765 [Bradyrhizobium sp.]|jgi:hypothetical protein|nr:hypothetical protein [Bradyrhizobium sp.]MEA2951820.1 hypothetical protein [Alphaproteobacteria bacterium]
MHLIDQVSSSALSAHAFATLIGDTARIVLFLALAHFAYGVLHMLVDALSERQDRFARYGRRICKATIDILIYLMAGLYGLEYLVMKAGESV